MSVKKVALSFTLKAKPGKEDAVAAFLANAQVWSPSELGTISWFAFRVDQRTFGIFDSFGSDAARPAHLQGTVAAALLGHAEELLDGSPEIRPVDILAEKLLPERRSACGGASREADVAQALSPRPISARKKSKAARRDVKPDNVPDDRRQKLAAGKRDRHPPSYLANATRYRCRDRAPPIDIQRTRVRRTPLHKSVADRYCDACSRACERVWVATSPSGARAVPRRMCGGRVGRRRASSRCVAKKIPTRLYRCGTAKRNKKCIIQILPGDRTHERRALPPVISYCGFHFDVCSARFRLRSEAV
jgi:quinol monooxygenase YgiN